MKTNKVDINTAIEKARELLNKEKNISSALKSAIEILFILVSLLLEKKGLNSANSSKPPSDDKNRGRGSKKEKSDRKPGGQHGRTFEPLKPVSTPDKVEEIKVDLRTLPKGKYREVGYDKRQVIDIETNIVITEYRAQILEDDQGKQYKADFPCYVTRPIQYGPKTKTTSVYMSQFQLIPYGRIEDYFADQIGLNLSTGSIFNFNQEAYGLLANFEEIAKDYLINSLRLNADETGINVNGKRIWLHTICNDKWTYFYPHEKRGSEAMEAIGILPNYRGVLCHDHWKAYYKYDCLHALCNAHHIRELEWCVTEDKQEWARKLSDFLKALNQTVEDSGGSLPEKDAAVYRQKYNALLIEADAACPGPEARKSGRRGKLKRSKSRNLLERLIHYQEDVLRFMTDKNVPFTNNQGENDLRMTKVQQKISGCFRSIDGALIFCRIRAYLITCRKHGVSATEALEGLFTGVMPAFIQQAKSKI